ncbi:MAG: hypothetical protein E6Y04_08205 [Corynebacterium sp.]|uniref:hypothetical protein n=1 Tax=Corynebacterium sp. TaxID=1720 RepID=UPI00290BF235|nr:hypothetical protein [Corynebacterium sp.]MDU4729937.1 hypothetical protein [Corynebacterium sp.]
MDTVPIVVGEPDSQTLRQVVNAAAIADDATKREIEKLSAQAIHLVDSSTENARKAQDGAQRAETAAGEAKQSATNAEDAASRARSSASSANQTSIWVSDAKKRVEESASSAEKSASSAKADADRAAQIADTTSWDGDKLTVNGKTSPSLTGPKGDQGPRGIQGPKGDPSDVTKAQLDTAIASEKARTVGVTWTVPREADVAAKARVAQTGDYIQVAQSHTIYRVTSGGVEVERYGTRTLQASTDSSSPREPNQWLEDDDPWAGTYQSRVSPPEGYWLVELINPHDFAADLYIEGYEVATVTSGTAVYTYEFYASAKSDVYVQIPSGNDYSPITLRFTPIN